MGTRKSAILNHTGYLQKSLADGLGSNRIVASYELTLYSLASSHMGRRNADSFHENIPSRLKTKPIGSSAPPFFLTVTTKRSKLS